ncbi:MAG TPA: MBL fold metallo-hydrolase [Phototrophicaceae bacterium]|nr:MBL fold metallo-hydrolase [Phototrophicaceae bacterium]
MQLTESLLQVAEGIYQVQVPLPFALRIVNCYLLDNGDDTWTIVDTGLNIPDDRAVWQAAFEALGITPEQISQIVLTHVHPDHYGLAGWLQGLSGAPVKLSPREEQAAQEFWVGVEARDQATSTQMAQMGVPSEVTTMIIGGIAMIRAVIQPRPEHLEPIIPGESVSMGGRQFRAIHAPGHSDGQLLFYDEADRLLISGDHVLMKITPNIAQWPETDPDPLGRFLDSLTELSALDVRLALPGHRQLITDWSGRIAEMIAHHIERLGRVREILDGGEQTAYQVATRLFDFERLRVREEGFAVVETMAHLDYLVRRDAITQIDGDVWRFRN